MAKTMTAVKSNLTVTDAYLFISAAKLIQTGETKSWEVQWQLRTGPYVPDPMDPAGVNDQPLFKGRTIVPYVKGTDPLEEAYEQLSESDLLAGWNLSNVVDVI